MSLQRGEVMNDAITSVQSKTRKIAEWNVRGLRYVGKLQINEKGLHKTNIVALRVPETH